MGEGITVKVSEHFSLEEFLPKGSIDEPPDEVRENIREIAALLLEPLRTHFGVPVVIHSGYRPAAKNAAVGGVPSSDHERGAAADFHVAQTPIHTWEENTIAAFDWLRMERDGAFGQLILEDHRLHYGDPGKLWVHVSLKTSRHAGSDSDRNRLLVSYEPRKYELWRDTRIG